MSRLRFLAAMAFAAIAVLPSPAMAAGEAPATVDLMPLVTAILQPVLLALAGVVASWLAARLVRWLKVGDEARMAATLDQAMHNAIALAINRYGPLARIEVGSQAMASAANYVTRALPGYLRALRVGPEELEHKLEARWAARFVLPEVQAGAAPPIGR